MCQRAGDNLGVHLQEEGYIKASACTLPFALCSCLDWELANCVKGQIPFRFGGPATTVTTISFCCVNEEAATDNTERKGCDCKPVKFYLQKRVAIWRRTITC